MREITLITGDGIGPEICDAARRCIEHLGVSVDWDIHSAGSNALKDFGDPLPPKVIDSIKRTKVALKAPVTTPIGKGFRSVNVRLRQTLGLFACVRPVCSIKGIGERQDVSLVVVRENTQCLYSGIEFESGSKKTNMLSELLEATHGVRLPAECAVTLRPISVEASDKICDFAFEWARRKSRKKVSCLTKSNIMKETDGLFLKSFQRSAKNNPWAESEHVLIDAACMRLCMRPAQFDVMVMPNLYGDIVSDLAAGLVGGLGVVPGANMGSECAVFEPVHGSAPDIAGAGIANPTALLLSAVMMLDHIKEQKAAKKLEYAVKSTISKKTSLTPDLGGSATTDLFTDAILDAMD